MRTGKERFGTSRKSNIIVFSTISIFLLANFHVTAADQVQKVFKLGILRPVKSSDSFTEALRQGLRQLGYIEGRNLEIVQRFSSGREDQLPDLAHELVRLNLDVIVASSTPAARAVQNTSRVVPLVFVAVTDPVVSGLVGSLAHPAGNATGLTTEPTPELSGKRLELLKEVVPKITGVAVLDNPANPAAPIVSKQTREVARILGLQAHFIEVRNTKDIESAFEVSLTTEVNALTVLLDPLFIINQKRLALLAAKRALPAIYPWKEIVDSGGLMSYGPNFLKQWRRAANYVDKILRGAKPADLPVERPRQVEFVINLKAAKEIGLAIPPHVLQRANQVIR